MSDCPYGHPKAKWDYQCRTCGWVDYQALVEDLFPSPSDEPEKQVELDRQSFAAEVFILSIQRWKGLLQQGGTSDGRR